MSSALESLIADRAAAQSAPLPVDGAARLARYVELLAHWNRRVNLTSLDIDPPTDAAIDRLIVEPLIAARWVRPTDRRAIDVGSGGGSPAIPMAIACPSLHVTMVESRGKKCAFLRETVRELGLANADVHQGRFGAGLDLPGRPELLTVRAVRLDSVFWQLANKYCSKKARVIALSASIDELPEGWESIVQERGLRVLEK